MTPPPRTTPPPALALVGIHHVRPTVTVPRLRIDPGRLVVLHSPPGDQRRTLLAIAAGRLTPDTGRADSFGHPAASTAGRTQIGWAPTRLPLPDRLPAAALLHHIGRLHRVDPRTLPARRHELLRLLALPADERPAATFPPGLRHRLHLALALIAAPRLLICEDPGQTADPDTTQIIIDTLRRFVAAGGAVLTTAPPAGHPTLAYDTAVTLTDGRLETPGDPDPNRPGPSR